ncbi:Pollen-specific protein SF3 [Fasciola gigantica]|uniref:Pollen-specific protein SF3 n=1 Tax=Fasciola gigantica TaxID=46835 RepID=A0A504YWT5_FASGI|nr:Pollen-specific protein SF3 [Fasciola gigantica]
MENPQKIISSPCVEKAKYFQRCLPDRESDYSPVRETPADNYDLPLKHKGSHQIKLNNEAGLASKHAKAKNVVITRSSMNKSAANSMPMVYDPSVIDEGKLFQQKVFSRPDGSIHIERLQPPRQTMLAACSSTESTYPGLHIYVTESPPRPYYDVVSSFESPETHAPRRTIACDPITISCLPCAATKSERTISPIPRKQRGEKENVEARINLMRKSFEQIQPHSVASRVEAFTALLKPKEQKNLSESNCTIRSTPEITENRIKSLNDDRCKERTYSHLQRSATINYGKSGYLTVPKITEYCFTCCKRIYPVDRVSIEDRVYHKGCFRCATCQRIVLPGNFASLDGIILCKPHYIEQFRLSGKYELRSFSIKVPNYENFGTSSPVFEA